MAYLESLSHVSRGLIHRWSGEGWTTQIKRGQSTQATQAWATGKALDGQDFQHSHSGQRCVVCDWLI